MGSKYIDLLSDFGFKKVFGKENCSEEFLIDFLNAIFRDDPMHNDIVTVKYKNVEKSPEHTDDKSIRYDLYCETNTGHRFIVEMQKRNKYNFKDRVTYYLAREIVEQGIRAKDRTEWNYEYLPIVGVFITNFFVDGIDRDLLVRGKMLNPDTGNVVLEKMSCVFLQLAAFNKSAEECETGFEKWAYVLKNMEKLHEMPFKTYKNHIFERLGELSKVSNLSERERNQYNDYLKWARDYNAELRYERGEGEARGRAEGFAEGEARGRAEAMAEVERKLRAAGIDPSILSN